MKICIVAPISTFDNIRVFHKEAKSLVKYGYSIVYFSRINKSQTVSNISVKKVPSFKIRYLSFVYLPILFFRLLTEEADVYQLHNPDTLLLGFGLKLLGKKVIYDTHENFKFRTLMRDWLPKWLRPLIAKIIFGLEKRAAHKFDGTIVTQEDMVEIFGEKAVFLPNAPIVKGEMVEQANLLSQKVEICPCFRAIYIGGLSMDRGLFTMINAMGALSKHIKARLWLIGPEPKKKELLHIEQLPGWRYVDYLGCKSLTDTWAYLPKSDVGLAVLSDKGDYPFSSANKLYEYQAFALPFIASNFYKWRQQLEKENAGIFITPDSEEELVTALLKLASNKDLAIEMGQNGKNFVQTQFNWGIEEKKLISLYETILM